MLSQKLKRGSITANLSVTRSSGAGGIRVNREALAVVMKLANDLAAEIEAAPPRIDGLLALKGVLESGEEAPEEGARERQMTALHAGFESALAGLAAMRQSEGARLDVVLKERLDEIALCIFGRVRSSTAYLHAVETALRQSWSLYSGPAVTEAEPRPQHSAELETAPIGADT